MSARPEWRQEKRTGRFIASVSLSVEVRDLTLLAAVDRALARRPGLVIEGVARAADSDNPGWRSVRAAAIAAALDRGRDYAAALGGELRRVEHVADTGLLASGAPSRASGSRRALSGSFHSDESVPDLDPRPIELTAEIEARLVAAARPLRAERPKP